MREPTSQTNAQPQQAATETTANAKPDADASAVATEIAASRRRTREGWIYGTIGLIVIGLVVFLWLPSREDAAPPADPAKTTDTAAPAAVAPCDGALRDDFSGEGATLKGPGLAVIPVGAYRMGEYGSKESDEKSGPEVTLAYPVAISACEVSVQDYGVFARETGRSWPYEPEIPERIDPATMVSWDDAVAYSKWLALKTGKPYRLASEAEWEWAARGGYESGWPWGDSDGPICQYGNLRGASSRAGVALACVNPEGIQPGGTLKRSDWGLYDLFGNVAEWTADCYVEPYPNASSSGKAVEVRDCKERVFRGGAWINRSEHARPGFRAHAAADYRDYFVGFRVARDATDEEQVQARLAPTPAPEAVAASDASASEAGNRDVNATPPSNPAEQAALTQRIDLTQYLSDLESDDEKKRREARDRLATVLAERNDPDLTREFIGTARAPNAGYRRWIGVTEVIRDLGRKVDAPRITDPEGALRIIESLVKNPGVDEALKESIYQATRVIERSRRPPASAA